VNKRKKAIQFNRTIEEYTGPLCFEVDYKLRDVIQLLVADRCAEECAYTGRQVALIVVSRSTRNELALSILFNDTLSTAEVVKMIMNVRVTGRSQILRFFFWNYCRITKEKVR
jgi:hypothetical protein